MAEAVQAAGANAPVVVPSLREWLLNNADRIVAVAVDHPEVAAGVLLALVAHKRSSRVQSLVAGHGARVRNLIAGILSTFNRRGN